MPAQKCYHCQNLLKDSELIIKPIPMQTKGGLRNYKRKFHIDCLPKFLEVNTDIEFRESENSARDELYQYIKTDILNLKGKFPSYWIHKIDGLYTGQFIARGVNRRGLTDRGYSYETIHLAIETAKPWILERLSMSDIKDDKHRCNALCYIIEPLLPVLQEGQERMVRAERKVDELTVDINIDYNEEFKEVQQNKKEEKKEVQSFADLFGDFNI